MSAPATALAPQLDRSTPLGATVVPGGVTVRTWAPHATKVFVLTGESLAAARQAELNQMNFSPAAGETMTSLDDGTWAAFLPGAGDGTSYMFWIEGEGSVGLKRDPRARELTPNFPQSDCLVVDATIYPWHDEAFQAPEFRDLVLYQLHVGTFYATDAAGNDKRPNVAKFLDILDRVDYLRELGVNGVELLPIQEFETPTSMGYNGLDLFSPEMDYQVKTPDLPRYLTKVNTELARHGKPPLTSTQLGTGPDQLKCLIDILHLNGISLLFDIVFNHAGPPFDAACLEFFDRQKEDNLNNSLYFTDQGWAGGLIFAYWNQDVRQFLIDNALASLQEFHIDGIRYDEVTVIDTHGGGRFCQDLTSTVRYVKPRAIQIAEYWGDDRAAAVRPSPDGLGFDACWNDRLRNTVRGAIGQASCGRDSLVDLEQVAAALDTPPGFSPWQSVNCLENHDLVFDGRGPRMAMLADANDPQSWYARSRARVAAGLLLTARGIPMIFMGQESLESKQWTDCLEYHPDLLVDWDALNEDGARKDYLKFTTDLLNLRATLPALRGDSLRVSRVHNLDRVMAIHRWIEWQGEDVMIVLNLQESNRFGYRIGFPGAGEWREVFNSDFYDNFPNNSTVGNCGSITAENVGWDGMPASAEITIPANGLIIFTR